MQQNDETRFEDFVGLISGLYKEIQRIKTSEGARLGLKGSDVMCLYYLERSKDGLTGADLARMAGVTRAAVSRTLAHLEEGGYVEVDDSGDAAVKYRAPVRLTALGGESMSEATASFARCSIPPVRLWVWSSASRCMRRCVRFSTPCVRSKAAKAFASH